MFRTVRSIFILFLIGITASGIPIYSSSVSANPLLSGFSLPSFNLPALTSSKNTIYVTSEQNVISSNHTQINLGFSPKSNSSYSNFFFDESNPFTIELSSNEDIITNLSLDDLISAGGYTAMEFYSEDDIRYIAFEFEQEKLDLPDGSYNLKIMPHIKDKEVDMNQSQFTINFNTKAKYVQDALSIKNGQTALTLYFPDNEFNFLIPITRVVRSNIYPLTTTVRNLEEGPSKDLGLPTGSFIPTGSTAGKAGRAAHVRLPWNISAFEQGSTSATIGINSFVKSLTSLDGISEVQFFLSGKYSQDPFHGLDMSKPFNKLDEPEIYTGYISDTNRFLLSPVPLSRFYTKSDDINIRTIFDTMKFILVPEIYNAKRHPLVPNDIDLLEYSLDNGLLTLIFDEQFTKAYESNPARHKMMVDGIILTFMTVDGVDSISIKIRSSLEGSNSGQLINFDIDTPVYPNPEIKD